jgi:hypothetical protein
MSTISTISPNVASRLEENAASTVFWSTQYEIYPAIAEAMMLATLITGEPQVRGSAPYIIPASTIFTPLAMPSDAIALLRVEGPNSLPIQKCWIWDLDRQLPGWEVATGDTPQFWVPFGLSFFGVIPCLTAPAQIVLSYVQTPVLTPPPYTGNESIPFATEYFDGLEDLSEVIARFKEGNPEFQQAFTPLNRALACFEALSRFAYRKNSLRFTRAGGASSALNDVRSR